MIAGKTSDDFVFTKDGDPVPDFRWPWWKACAAAGLGEITCCKCNQPSEGKYCKCGGRNHYSGLIFHDLPAVRSVI